MFDPIAQINAFPLPMSAESQAPIDEKAWGVAKDFEALMMGQMVEQMFSGLDQDGFFSGGYGEKMARGMLSEPLGKALSSSGTLGIAEAIYRDISGIYQSYGTMGDA
ncbi:hypothetical protein JCM17846_10060 [Iodidimonas nitroreducens]|uniref:Flagellar protein FlgJ N-terminal domain-containing protein n=2 Tax=Iodidimonas nitroreducens TaxID=1236968 RepID=A0A5A7N6H4_9PROT|nr:chemotactic signal-response protein CheL [alpha proteobacterium Q-1]GER03324.1 hypothetical protein JCM17846_10060 [Iodidimonas nitroreducens]